MPIFCFLVFFLWLSYKITIEFVDFLWPVAHFSSFGFFFFEYLLYYIVLCVLREARWRPLFSPSAQSCIIRRTRSTSRLTCFIFYIIFYFNAFLRFFLCIAFKIILEFMSMLRFFVWISFKILIENADFLWPVAVFSTFRLFFFAYLLKLWSKRPFYVDQPFVI